MSLLKNYKIVGLGCSTFTPLTLKQIENYGISDLYLEIVTNKDIYMVVRQPFYKANIFTIFMKEHYNIDVDFKFIYKSDRTSIIKFNIKDKNTIQ